MGKTLPPICPSVDWALAIPRFLRDAEAIQADPLKALVTFPDLFLSLSFLGGGYLQLGAAVRAWGSGALCRPCPRCFHRAWVLRAGGSPLSGSGGWTGICPNCGTVGQTEPVVRLVLDPAVRGHWSPLGHRPIVQPASPWSFSFREGAVQTGDQPEIRLEVPGWKEFLDRFYPDLAGPEPESSEGPNPTRLGDGLR